MEDFHYRMLSMITNCRFHGCDTVYSRKLEISIEQDCIIWGNRVVIPSALRDKVLKDLHQSHPGMSKMKALARSYFWWPEMDKNIENVVMKVVNRRILSKMPNQSVNATPSSGP